MVSPFPLVFHVTILPMMTSPVPANILNILKTWLSRLMRRSASFNLYFISSLRRAAAGQSKLGVWRLIAWIRSSSGALSRSRSNTAGANEPVCPSLLPARIELEVAGEALSPTDDTRSRISRSSRPLRESTAVPLSKNSNMTAKRYADAHPRLVSVLRHGSSGPDSAPLHSPAQAVPTSDTRIKRHVHYTVPPGSDEQPGPEVVIVHDSLLIAPMVAADVRQYQKSVPR